jgi:hypothetical protein
MAFIAIHRLFGSGKPKIGAHPPKKNAANMYDKANMLPYSAKKNNANAIELYSMLYPATISASASGKSNGVPVCFCQACDTKDNG